MRRYKIKCRCNSGEFAVIKIILQRMERSLADSNHSAMRGNTPMLNQNFLPMAMFRKVLMRILASSSQERFSK